MMKEIEIRHLKELEKERQQSRNSIEYLKGQTELKDNRMDILMNALIEKDAAYTELLKRFFNCPYCKLGKGDKI